MNKPERSGRLVLVPTPIGNLEDMTFRAVRVLREADVIACEDTRTTGFLCQHFEIQTPRISYHDHNEASRAPALVARMRDGDVVALVTDAGSPGISDPGFYLVREAIRADIVVEALPGATAVIPALTISGLPADRFTFEGFLPQKKGRMTRLTELASADRTVVLYESPHRLGKLFRQMLEVMDPDRPVVVCRELTKKFEEVRRGTVGEFATAYEDMKVKGEVVVVLGHVEAGLPSADDYLDDPETKAGRAR
jgi:16S rRNA (cytidine1402-2'-O)-methyltransferase